jgi:hypothetical protein
MDGNNKMKVCTKCHKEKSLIQFHISKIFRDKHNNWCKECMKIYHKKYREINKQKIKIQNKIYRLLNKNKIIKYKKLNIDKIRKRENIYLKSRRITDINYRLRKNLSKRIWQSLCGRGKSKFTAILIGNSIEKLKQHLESKFVKGMTWDNYGRHGWEIDHIIPCSKFDLSKLSEQYKCFHYTNLQPLWAKDNRRKSNLIK